MITSFKDILDNMAWRTVFATACWRYDENRKSGERRAVYLSGTEKVDVEWLAHTKKEIKFKELDAKVSMKDRAVAYLAGGGAMLPVVNAYNEHWTWNGNRALVLAMFLLIGAISLWIKDD